MNIVVNGDSRVVGNDLTLDALLQELTTSTRGSAAAVDGEVVPRAEWTTYRLQEGQAVEILTAVQGG